MQLHMRAMLQKTKVGDSVTQTKDPDVYQAKKHFVPSAASSISKTKMSETQSQGPKKPMTPARSTASTHSATT